MANEKEEVNKESGIIPEEYVLKNKEFSIDEWRKMKIDEALKFQQARVTQRELKRNSSATQRELKRNSRVTQRELKGKISPTRKRNRSRRA